MNLASGVPPGETSVTCTAGVGTFVLEFATLSRLTGNPAFERVALRALKALWATRSTLGLVSLSAYSRWVHRAFALALFSLFLIFLFCFVVLFLKRLGTIEPGCCNF